MADVVVDASVWVSRLVAPDVHHESTVRWFERQEQEAGLLVAPALMPAEVAGVLARVTRSPALARRGTARLLRVPSLRIVSLDRRLGERAAELAADLGLRGADATYVAIAAHLGLPLVTWDAEQRSRAAAAVRASAPG